MFIRVNGGYMWVYGRYGGRVNEGYMASVVRGMVICDIWLIEVM